jgi:hypothetical protein
LFVIRVVLLLIVMVYVLFVCKCVLPPGVNPTAVDKYINLLSVKHHVQGISGITEQLPGSEEGICSMDSVC